MLKYIQSLHVLVSLPTAETTENACLKQKPKTINNMNNLNHIFRKYRVLSYVIFSFLNIVLASTTLYAANRDSNQDIN